MNKNYYFLNEEDDSIKKAHSEVFGNPEKEIKSSDEEIPSEPGTKDTNSEEPANAEEKDSAPAEDDDQQNEDGQAETDGFNQSDEFEQIKSLRKVFMQGLVLKRSYEVLTKLKNTIEQTELNDENDLKNLLILRKHINEVLEIIETIASNPQLFKDILPKLSTTIEIFTIQKGNKFLEIVKSVKNNMNDDKGVI